MLWCLTGTRQNKEELVVPVHNSLKGLVPTHNYLVFDQQFFGSGPRVKSLSYKSVASAKSTMSAWVPSLTTSLIRTSFNLLSNLTSHVS
jgi:hypothetical protein